jgi:FKBP-type peptidyl-prolyl cis-trans isomerase FklB
MKKILILGSMLISISLSAQKQGAKPNAAAPLKLKNYKDSLQYALGAYMGNFLLQGGFSVISMDYFLAGMNDIYKNNPRLVKDSIGLVMVNGYQDKMAKQLGQQLEVNLFNALKDKPGVGKLPSGVQYLVIKAGKGQRPLEADSVVIHYKGTLGNGNVFENTFVKNTPILTTPGTLIPALNEVLQLMPVGSTWQVFVPASQGYGEKGSGSIPPNSALLFALELVEVRSRK